MNVSFTWVIRKSQKESFWARWRNTPSRRVTKRKSNSGIKLHFRCRNIPNTQLIAATFSVPLMSWHKHWTKVYWNCSRCHHHSKEQLISCDFFFRCISYLTPVYFLFSRFIGPLLAVVQRLEQALASIWNILDEWVNVQAKWLYLEGVFIGGDIREQLPDEAKKFDDIDRSFIRVIRSLFRCQCGVK